MKSFCITKSDSAEVYAWRSNFKRGDLWRYKMECGKHKNTTLKSEVKWQNLTKKGFVISFLSCFTGTFQFHMSLVKRFSVWHLLARKYFSSTHSICCFFHGQTYSYMVSLQIANHILHFFVCNIVVFLFLL